MPGVPGFRQHTETLAGTAKRRQFTGGDHVEVARPAQQVHGHRIDQHIFVGDVGIVAPHLVSDLAFVVPNYEWWESPFYGVGLKVYNLLAGRYGFGESEILTKEETLARLPTIKTEGLRGGVVYYDGQFDDARLLVHLAMTAVEQGAILVNYCEAESLLRNGEGSVNGAVARDQLASLVRPIEHVMIGDRNQIEVRLVLDEFKNFRHARHSIAILTVDVYVSLTHITCCAPHDI